MRPKFRSIVVLAIVATVVVGAIMLMLIAPDSQKTSPTTTQVGWEEAKRLVEGCQVIMVSQTHNRHVSLRLKDGQGKSTIEPHLDDILETARKASSKCGFDIAQLTE